ncbi:hypothetical protein D3C80_2059360 [compost metagenome]
MGHHDQLLKAWQLGAHLVDLVDLIDGLAGIVVTGANNQQLGGDLTETVDDAVHTEFG